MALEAQVLEAQAPAARVPLSWSMSMVVAWVVVGVWAAVAALLVSDLLAAPEARPLPPLLWE